MSKSKISLNKYDTHARYQIWNVGQDSTTAAAECHINSDIDRAFASIREYPDIRHVITQVPSTQHYPHGAEKGISHDRPCELHVVFQRHESVQSPYSPLLHCSHCGPSKPDPAWLVRRRTSQYAAQSEHKTTVEETCFADTRSACLASTVLAARVVGIARNLARWSIPPLAACRAVRARSILEAAA